MPLLKTRVYVHDKKRGDKKGATRGGWGGGTRATSAGEKYETLFTRHGAARPVCPRNIISASPRGVQDVGLFDVAKNAGRGNLLIAWDDLKCV